MTRSLMNVARRLLLSLRKAASFSALLACACASPAANVLDGPGAAHEVLVRQQAAWNEGDVEAFMAEGYWRSERLTFLSGGDWTLGYNGVLERYRRRYLAEGKEMGTLEFSDEEFVSLGPDATLARGRYHLDFADGTAADGLFTLVLRRMDGAWRIVHDHTSAAADG
ncbi:MAG: nuclear transport factor 2 family protein [Planctomycetota bacterium]